MSLSVTFEQVTNTLPAIIQPYARCAYFTGTVSSSGGTFQSKTLTLSQGQSYTLACSVYTDANTTLSIGIWDITSGGWLATPISVGASSSSRVHQVITAATQADQYVFLIKISAVVTTTPINAYIAGPQLESGNFPTPYKPNILDYLTNTLPLQGHDSTVQTAATKANSAIDSNNIIVPSSIDFTRPYTGKGNLATKNSVDLSAEVENELPWVNAPGTYKQFWDSSGNLISTVPLYAYLPNSILNIISDVAMQYTSTTTSIFAWVTNLAGNSLPTWTFPGIGVSPITPPAAVCGSSASPVFQWTGLNSSTTYYPIIWYNINSKSFSGTYYSQPLTPTQMMQAYGDGNILAVCGSANTNSSIRPTAGGSGSIPGGGGTQLQ